MDASIAAEVSKNVDVNDGLTSDANAVAHEILGEDKSEKIENLDSAENLDATECDLQRKYQMAVICSHASEEFPAAKAFPLAQKEAASKVYQLFEKNHFLLLQVNRAEKLLAEYSDMLEQKWIASIQPPLFYSGECTQSPHELKFWYLQMKKYEEKYAQAVNNFPGSKKFNFLPTGQLFFDATWVQEAFDETLTFFSETSDQQLRICIKNNGDELTSESSMYMEKLPQLVEDCFQQKKTACFLMRKIWALFRETFFKDVD